MSKHIEDLTFGDYEISLVHYDNGYTAYLTVCANDTVHELYSYSHENSKAALSGALAWLSTHLMDTNHDVLTKLEQLATK